MPREEQLKKNACTNLRDWPSETLGREGRDSRGDAEIEYQYSLHYLSYGWITTFCYREDQIYYTLRCQTGRS